MNDLTPEKTFTLPPAIYGMAKMGIHKTHYNDLIDRIAELERENAKLIENAKENRELYARVEKRMYQEAEERGRLQDQLRTIHERSQSEPKENLESDLRDWAEHWANAPAHSDEDKGWKYAAAEVLRRFCTSREAKPAESPKDRSRCGHPIDLRSLSNECLVCGDFVEIPTETGGSQ